MINFAIYILELVSVILIIHVVFQSRVRWDFAVVILLLVSANISFLAYITQILYITYLAHIATLLYCMYEFRRSLLETLFKFACSVAIGAILETMFLMEVNSWLQTSKHSMSIYLGISIGILVCSIILYWFFIYKKISFKIDIADKTFIVLVIVINLFVLYVKNEGNGRYLRLIVCIISFVVLIARFAMITKKESKREIKEQTEWLSQYTAQYESLIQEVRRRQHDYKNEIQTIKSAYTSVGNAIAMEMIKEYENSEQYTSILNGCEHPIIAGLLYSKVKEYEAQGVTMICRVCMRNVELALELREIIAVIGILLDNAYECTKEQKKKTMQLEIEEKEKGVSITTSNPSPYIRQAELSKMFTLGYSTKGKNRGIGLNTVQQLVNKCQGDIITGNQTVNEINHFIMKIIIPYKKVY